jgi:predicted small metal-binding protein
VSRITQPHVDPVMDEPRLFEEATMFEFICSRVIPGCEHKETGDTAERVREKAVAHLHEHHDLAYLDEPTEQRLSQAILPVHD